MKRQRDRERGATLVEFALILPVFMMLVLGMFTGGLVYNQKLQMTHATREGARYGATVPENQAFANGDTWANNVRELVVQRSAGDLTTAEVCVALVDGGNDDPVSEEHTTKVDESRCFEDASSDTDKRVQVSATRPAEIEALFFSIPLTLTVTATAKYEGA